MKIRLALCIVCVLLIGLSGCRGSADNSSGVTESSAFNSPAVSSESTSKNSSSQKSSSSVTKNDSSSKAVSSNQTSSASQSDKEKRITQIMNGKILQSDKYVLETYVSPFWEGNIVYNESVYPLGNQDGSINPISLLYNADMIIDVRSSDLKTQYTEGKDYALENGKLVILTGSSIPIQDYGRFYLSTPLQNKSFERVNGGYLFFSEGITFHSRQIAVTYAHLDSWAGSVPDNKGSKLPNLMKKLERKENINIVFSGDSITQGANSSGAIGAEPNAPRYIDMFCDQLKAKYGVSVTSTNSSEGGQISSWGLTNIQKNVIDHNPDLVVLAFGMNDGTATNRVAPSTFQANMLGMINAVKAKNPNCEFILVSSMLPNPDLKLFTLYQPEYPTSLLNIEGTASGVAVANVTEMHIYIMSKKRYFDMTGNNVNHPNDFVARLYTQTLLKTIQK